MLMKVLLKMALSEAELKCVLGEVAHGIEEAGAQKIQTFAIQNHRGFEDYSEELTELGIF